MRTPSPAPVRPPRRGVARAEPGTVPRVLQLISDFVTLVVVFALVWLALLLVSVALLTGLAVLALATVWEQDGDRGPGR